MAEHMKALKNQPKPNVSSSSMDVSMNAAPQWFDMEAPGGVRVAEKAQIPALELPPVSDFKSPDATTSKDHSSAPPGGASGGGGGGGDPNTKSKEADKITLEPLPT
eukprot:2677408-Karenia_brevis.AAC.1